MLALKKVVPVAKYLASISFDADSGEVALSNVQAVIQYISECPERYRAKLLKKYGYFLEEAIRQRSLSVEYARGCDIDRIKQIIPQQAQRVSRVNVKENSELICGVRLSFGDFIWERSVRSDLELITH